MRKDTDKSGVLRKSARLLVLCLFAGIALIGWELLVLQGEQAQYTAERGDAGWGAESIAALPERLMPGSLIAPANACGMGASSCFQCHNGNRAEAPSDEAWHTEHAAVNNSCVGCHKGNPRLMREDMAHRNLIVDPREKPAETCANCHRGDDLDALRASYSSGN